MATPGSGLLSGVVQYQNTVRWYIPQPAAAQSFTIAPAAVSASTGVSPQETSYSLYGHIIPLSVFGVGRIGCEIIAGPWVESGLASFIVSAGVPADPSGTRILREIAFDSEVVWTGSLTGAGTPSSSGFTVEPFTCRFYDGTLTQGVDALESTHFGAQANAYRPQILLAVENLPLASTKFKKIPYIAMVIADTSGDDVNLGEAFERLAYSPWVGWTSSEFETSGITDGLVDGGLIIAQDMEFLQLAQQFGRDYPSWDILQTDKLRIVDRGDSVTEDIAVNPSRLMGEIKVIRQGQDTVKKDLELSTIDPGADYTIIPSVAQIPRYPVSVTASVGKEGTYLPAIMDSATRVAVVTYAKYHEEATRKRISGTLMAYGLEVEPGVLMLIYGIGDNFRDETFRIVETLHGANYAVEFIAESIFNCNITSFNDPHWANVHLLMGFEDVNGSQGSPGLDDESLGNHGTGNAVFSSEVSTAQSLFGAGSLDTHTGPVTFLSDDWQISSTNSDPFTVECAAYFNSIGNFTLIGETAGGGNQAWMLQITSAGHFQFEYSTTGATFDVLVGADASLTTGVWYQFAVDKDATGKIRVYVDGDMIASATPANSAIHDPGSYLSIGSNGLLANKVNGYMDEVRITLNVARYASDAGYTPATGAFPRF